MREQLSVLRTLCGQGCPRSIHLFRKSVGSKTEEFHVFLGIKSRLASGDVHLLDGGDDALQVGKQKAARVSAFLWHDYAVRCRSEIDEGARRRLTQNI